MHSHILETDRLILRALTLDDAPSMFVWASDPIVNRYMRYPLYTSVEQAYPWLSSVTDSPYDFGFVRKSDGLLIGSGGIYPPDESGKDWELGYNLRRDCWGQGYATEAARAMLRYAREIHGIQDFIACHVKANVASGRVMEKCGFTYDHDSTTSRFDGSETFETRCYKLHLD